MGPSAANTTAGRVPYLKVGRFVRFDPIEVERWVIATRVDPLDLPASVGRRRGR